MDLIALYYLKFFDTSDLQHKQQKTEIPDKRGNHLGYFHHHGNESLSRHAFANNYA